MPFTTQQIRQTRLLIADTNTATQILTDTDITDYLTLEGGVVKLAAAAALDAIASSEALVSKVIATQDLRTDGAKVADALRAHADRLRAQAEADDQDGAFSVVPAARYHVELSEWV